MWRATLAAARPSSARRRRSGAPCWYCRRRSRPASASCRATLARISASRRAIDARSDSIARRRSPVSNSARWASLTAFALARSWSVASPRDRIGRGEVALQLLDAAAQVAKLLLARRRRGERDGRGERNEKEKDLRHAPGARARHRP